MADREALRTEVQRMMAAGKSPDEIRAYVSKAKAQSAGPRLRTPGNTASAYARQQLGDADYGDEGVREADGPDVQAVRNSEGLYEVPQADVDESKLNPLTRVYRMATGASPPGQRMLARAAANPDDPLNEKMRLYKDVRAMGNGLAAASVGGALMAPLRVAGEGWLGSRLGAAALEGAGAGTAGAAAEAATRGDDIAPAAGRGFATGALLGPALQLGGEALSAAGNGIRNLLRGNTQIGTYARANEGGVYQQPEMKALPQGAPGIRRAAEGARDKIIARDQELGREAGQAYQNAVDPEVMTPSQFARGGLGRPVDREALLSELNAARARNINPDTGAPVDAGLDAKFATAIKSLGAGGENTSFLSDVTRWVPKPNTVGGTLKLRRGLKADAAFGSAAPSDDQIAARNVYGAFRGAVRKAAPDVAAADDAYNDFAQARNRRRDILFGTEDNVVRGGAPPEPAPVDLADEIGAVPQTIDDELAASPSLRVGKEKAAATTLSRVNDTNDPGNAAAPFIQELADQDPQFAKAIQFIADKKALEGTRFGLGGHLPTSLRDIAASVGPTIRQNARAIGARVLEPAASDVAGANLGPGSLAPSLALTNPVLRAYAAELERKRRAVEALRGQVYAQSGAQPQR